jgi:diguanylate cyclase (GGDEF)-like protein/excisionase family DNA binding protein
MARCGPQAEPWPYSPFSSTAADDTVRSTRMTPRLKESSREIREQVASAIRDRSHALADDLAGSLAHEPGLDHAEWQSCSRVLIELLAQAIQHGRIDDRGDGIQDLTCLSPPLLLRQVIHAIDMSERVVLDELALDDRLGATSEPWPVVAHSTRAGALEVVVAFAEAKGGRAALRDQLTTLIAGHVFDLILEQEALRAHRHKHGVAMILFDIDDLAQVNRAHGYGAGDRLLERLGILARRFFRTHDWVARHGEDSIAVLLPETTLDQAATLAGRFCETVRQRLVLVDHKTDAITAVTVSAAAVGTDLVQAEIDPAYILAEADAAVLRAKMNGGNQVERVALMPTSVTIVGAATLLGTTARQVINMVRRGTLRATRRGRHFHIDRSQIEEYRRK